jgi:prevent-host-death family protein
MSTISVAEAEGQWSALIDRVEAGETVSLTRLGKEVARLTPAERPKIRIDAEDLRALTDKRLTPASMAFSPSDIEELRALTESMPISDEDGGEFIRKMRDDARY